MTRTPGRHSTERTPQVDPESPEGRDIGMSKRTQGVPSPIPGGREHITQAPAVRREPPRPAPRPEYHGQNAHGVPPGTFTSGDRADMMRGPHDVRSPQPRYGPTKEVVPPVPVYLVEQGSGPKPLRIAVPRHITVPGFNADPVLLCGMDSGRNLVRLLNEDASTNIRFANNLTSLLQDPGSGGTPVSIGGALLPKSMTSYLAIETGDELWAICQSASSTALVSIITESVIPWAG
jgi:hypothetical protein